MKNRIQKLIIILGVAVMAGSSVFAKKPESPGNSDTHKSQQENFANSPAHHDSEDSQNYFNDNRRAHIRNYYSESRKSGNCPPGLAKKNNGCQPPGQIKKWRKGEPLPGDVIYYDLPSALIDELGLTPEGDRVVQVGTDLLLISIGTGMVLDAFDIQE
jgi:Ni/Co efflux regulator RcnB